MPSGGIRKITFYPPTTHKQREISKEVKKALPNAAKDQATVLNVESRPRIRINFEWRPKAGGERERESFVIKEDGLELRFSLTMTPLPENGRKKQIEVTFETQVLQRVREISWDCHLKDNSKVTLEKLDMKRLTGRKYDRDRHCDINVFTTAYVALDIVLKEDEAKVNLEELGSGMVSLFETGELTDATLVCDDGQEINCHKTVLAIKSPVFRAMFGGKSFRESKEEKIKIVGIAMEDLKLLVEYMYKGKVGNRLKDRAMSLIIAADRYDLPKLKDECSGAIRGKLFTDNALEVFQVASLSNDKELKAAAKGYLKNFGSVIKEMPDFKQRLDSIPPALARELICDLL